ncbi:hypothetical protein [Cupriavidus pauculus]|uniref:hypothetical protein n=1 Tax=Cupriavidus pauculus TaxID=82633 RepID=UPI001D0C3454|nr:hypothetical protein [Cupriavidus pauculus]
MATKPTSADILARLQDAPGVRFATSQVAKLFRVNSSAVTPQLHELLQRCEIKSVTDGRFIVYWVPTPGERLAEETRHNRVTAASVAQPLTGYESQLRSHMRLCEGWRR